MRRLEPRRPFALAVAAPSPPPRRPGALLRSVFVVGLALAVPVVPGTGKGRGGGRGMGRGMVAEEQKRVRKARLL